VGREWVWRECECRECRLGSAIITIQAWITPGIQPRIVRRMFSRKEPEQPRRRRTARGGRKIAIRASQQPAWMGGLLVCGLVWYDLVGGCGMGWLVLRVGLIQC
jgi:hypothetical protein